MPAAWSYEFAIQKLRSLPPREYTRKRAVKYRLMGKVEPNLQETENLLRRVGIPLSRLDELSVVHVAGSIGKGSTSAMCESILRAHGFRTGMYVSPHIEYERERIRINGRPLSEEDFARHLQRMWELIEETQSEEPEEMAPNFSSFIVSMGLYVCVMEKVDVAIIETGCGGRFDYTNVLRKVPVVGITTIALEHTNLFGATLAEIADVKAGIMKSGCEAYTLRQSKEALDVLAAYAEKINCSLTVVPEYSSYTFPDPDKPVLSIDVDTFRANASLAIQLAHAWIRLKNGNAPRELVYEVPRKTVEGLRQFRWPGRYHVLERDFATIYMDFATTKKSAEACAQWFKTQSHWATEKVLIFNTTPDRNAEVMLLPFVDMPIKEIYFVVPIFNKINFGLEEQEENLRMRHHHAQIWKKYKPNDNVIVLESLVDVFSRIEKHGGKPAILIFGTFRLITETLSMFDPKCAV